MSARKRQGFCTKGEQRKEECAGIEGGDRENKTFSPAICSSVS